MEYIAGPSYHRNMTNGATQLYVRTRTAIHALLNRENGAGMVEYALLVSLIAIVLVVAVGFFAGKLDERFDAISSAVGDV